MKTLIVALYPYNARGLDSWHDHGAGMTYAAAKLAGHDVNFLDLKCLSSDNDLRESLRGYDLISFGLKSSYYPLGMKVKRIAKSLGSKVMIGGYHATAAPHELISDPEIDYILFGESEITFPKFLANPSNFKREIVGERPQNLDSLPWIDHSIYREPLEDCSGWWYGGRRKMTSVIAARGCPFKCSFCQPLEDNHFGKKLRRRSVNSVIDELLMLKHLYSPDCVMIHDDTFFVQSQWLEEFVEKYPQVNLPFWAAARADGICKHPDLLKKLVKVGWELVSVGFESGSQRILDRMNKGITVEQNLNAAHIIREAGAKIYANYMLGLPWEHKEDIQSTFSMADAINAEMPSWAYFTPYPGCGLGETCIKNNWSLLTKDTYDRCPSGQKVKFVDYDYLRRGLEGFRENYPKLLVDIIIPTYENEDLTLQCLAAVKAHTPEHQYRVILVDNGSKAYQRAEQAVLNLEGIFLRLDKNYGFVDAVNRGLEISTAPNICFLNNDTKVTARWFNKLMSALYSDGQMGIVGSLTGYHRVGADSHHSLVLHRDLLPNGACNWDMEKINFELEINYSGRTTPVSFVAFLCALMKREVFEKVGLLDVNYKMGMWDDVDYNMAAQKLGYKTHLAIDTCIYHKGRSTFDLIEKTEHFDVGTLLQVNKAYLDRKWAKPGTPLYIRESQKKLSMRMV